MSKHPVTRLRPASRSEQLAHPDRPLVPQLPVARGEQGGDRRRHGERRSDFLREPFEHSAPPAARRGLRLVGVSLGLAAMVAGSALAGRRLGATPTPPPPTTGTVEIQTNPPGARVSIDGQSTGMTPMTLTLTAGAHALELSGDGTARSIQLSVKAGGHTSQFVELPPPAPAPTGGRLEVRTDPSGVAVSIDGAAYGTTPTTIADLPPGDHVVVLSGPEGQVRRVVSIDADATTMLDVPLKEGASLPDRGWLVVSAPIDVTVRRDGRDLGQAGSDRIALEPGRHDLEFVNDALHYRAGRTVQIAAGRVRTIQLDVPTGSLAINALPWADAWVDGRPVGQTPLSSIGVAIGRHEVTLRHPELGERRRQIVVSPDAPTRLTVDFKQP